MKKVFEAEMSINFYDLISSKNIQKVYPFASADGITGDVILSDIQQESDTSIRAIVSVLTHRKRMYPDFESYLECVKTTLGQGNKISVTKLTDIVSKMTRTIDDCKVIAWHKNYQIAEDVDLTYLVLNPDATQKVIDCFDTLHEAEKFLASK